MEKCKICANQNTAWRKRCEHKVVPGLEQFDFYQEQKESEGDDGKQ